jgi:hypothetical protein
MSDAVLRVQIVSGNLVKSTSEEPEGDRAATKCGSAEELTSPSDVPARYRRSNLYDLRLALHIVIRFARFGT